MTTWCENHIFDKAEVAGVCVWVGGVFSFESAFQLFARRHPTKQASDVEGQLGPDWPVRTFTRKVPLVTCRSCFLWLTRLVHCPMFLPAVVAAGVWNQSMYRTFLPEVPSWLEVMVASKGNRFWWLEALGNLLGNTGELTGSVMRSWKSGQMPRTGGSARKIGARRKAKPGHPDQTGFYSAVWPFALEFWGQVWRCQRRNLPCLWWIRERWVWLWLFDFHNGWWYQNYTPSMAPQWGHGMKLFPDKIVE